MRPSPGQQSLAILLLALTLASCFEPPVREDLHLRFLPNGAVVVTSSVEIATPEGEPNPALERRLAGVRQAVLDGTDSWGPRFAALEPAAERFSWEKRLGEVRRATRSAAVAEPEDLARFFRDTSLSLFYEIRKEEGIAELSIAPGPSSRANRRQQKQMERALGEWSARVSEYLESAGKLYAYAEERPDRDRACFGALFSEVLTEGEREALPELTAEESAIVEQLGGAMEKVFDILLVPKGEDYSLDEVAHLVYDPFPARIALSFPAAPLEAEGFSEGEDEKSLVIPGHGLWASLQALEGRWIAPDPVLLYVEAQRSGGDEALDLDTFLGKPRRAEPAHLLPSATEVRRAIEGELKPAPFYRVSWRVDPDDETPFSWEE
jgi:hypothetical protein